MADHQLVENGIYEHYKGQLYRMHKIVRHSESLEEYVLYEALYENKLGQMWVRPLKMFIEKIKVNETEQPRFRFLKKDA